MLQELNKIAIVHLFLLGFEDEISNFTLSLTNPSKQADLLGVDVWKEKILLYKDMVSPIEGIAPTSISWAKKHILGFSDEEIKLDLQQQRIEKAVGAELTNTAQVITHTGLFDNLDRLYGKKEGEQPAAPAEGGESPGGDIGGGFTPPPPSGGLESPAPPSEPAGGPGLAPESMESKLNIILEGDWANDNEEIDLSKAKKTLLEMDSTLKNLLND